MKSFLLSIARTYGWRYHSINIIPWRSVIVVVTMIALLLGAPQAGNADSSVQSETPVQSQRASNIVNLSMISPDDPNSFTFAVTADQRQYTGSSYNNSNYFRGAMEAINGLGGGVFLVSSGDIDPVEDSVWTIEQVMGTDYLWYPVGGNHEQPGAGYEDYYGANMDYLRAYDYDQNGAGVEPNLVNTGPSGCPETTYSWEYGNAHFVAINEYCNENGDTELDGDVSDHVYNWLVSDLQGTDKEHIFVFGHEPAYPWPDADTGDSRHVGDSLDKYPSRRDRFWNLLRDEGVVAYICGHTHKYSAVQFDGVWQLDAGHARGQGDTSAPSTFMMIHIDEGTVTFDAYRDTHDGDYDYDDIVYSGTLKDGTSVRFAAIGDYGSDSQNEDDVASLVDGWNPDFVVTAGDNRYGSTTFDLVVGQFYCDYLKDAGSGTYCSGGNAAANAFFPSLGNHDYSDGGGINEYLSYFTLPGSDFTNSSGNERYYDFVQGPVHFFVINSNSQEPDGNSSSSTQASWLQTQLAASTTPWQIVYFHHAPYSSSSSHGSSAWMQWPFEAWGADAVITGHDHTYERLQVGNIPYFVNGLGGMSIYGFGTPIPESVLRYNDDYGAMLIEANNTSITYQFINLSGQVIDEWTYPPAGPITYAFQNGVLPNVTYNGAIDTYLSEHDPNTNYGNVVTCFAHGNSPSGSGEDKSALIKWDISAIPFGEPVASATITLKIVDPSASTYELYELKRDWVEIQATWNAYRTGSSWETSGAQGALDRGTTVLGTLTADSTGAYQIDLNADGLTVVEGWINDSSSNHGFIIANTDATNGVGFSCSEASTKTDRPLLTVNLDRSVPVTTEFQDGVSPTSGHMGTRDATLSEEAPTVNYGSDTACLIDGDDPPGSGNDKSVLLKWDVSDINPGEDIDSASITLNVFNETSGPYRLYEIKRDWVESEATWNEYRSSANWQTPGAKDDTLDRGSTILGMMSSTGTGLYTMNLNSDGIARVQAWVDDPASNFGMILADSSTTNGADFDCREVSTPGNRPKLTITHSLSIKKPVLNIDIENGTDNVLLWDDDDLNCSYEIYRQTAPYFDPDGADPELTLDSPATTHTFSGDAGNPSVNYFYLVRALSCTSGATADSTRTGSFDFALQPGSTN